jgi:hypothetical protein
METGTASDVADAAHSVVALVDSTAMSQWRAPTPCPDYDVPHLVAHVAHVVANLESFARGVPHALSTRLVPDALWSLSDQSLVTVAREGEGRYGLLAPVRDVASGHLRARPSEAEECLERHTRWVLDAAAAADEALRGAGAAAAMQTLDRLVAEARAAFVRLSGQGRVDDLARLCRALFFLGQERFHGEVFAWARATSDRRREIARVDAAWPGSLAAVAAWQQGDIEQARHIADDVVETVERADNAAMGSSGAAVGHLIRGERRTAGRRVRPCRRVGPRGVRARAPQR